jgi:hypothetical protein
MVDEKFLAFEAPILNLGTEFISTDKHIRPSILSSFEFFGLSRRLLYSSSFVRLPHSMHVD